jgi:hypothetical protein
MNSASGRFAIFDYTNECLLLVALVYICFPMKQILGALSTGKNVSVLYKERNARTKKMSLYRELCTNGTKDTIPDHCIVESAQKALQREKENRQIVTYLLTKSDNGTKTIS